MKPQPPSLEDTFPLLRSTPYTITSRRTPIYNCIAWAAGEDRRIWWPDDQSYWPDHVSTELAISSFIDAFSTVGYTPCADGELEDGLEKVVLYAVGERPTHAARQLPNGDWTSKCGVRGVDISHTLNGLNGADYGQPVRFLSRPRPTSADAQLESKNIAQAGTSQKSDAENERRTST